MTDWNPRHIGTVVHQDRPNHHGALCTPVLVVATLTPNRVGVRLLLDPSHPNALWLTEGERGPGGFHHPDECPHAPAPWIPSTEDLDAGVPE